MFTNLTHRNVKRDVLRRNCNKRGVRSYAEPTLMHILSEFSDMMYGKRETFAELLSLYQWNFSTLRMRVLSVPYCKQFSSRILGRGRLNSGTGFSDIPVYFFRKFSLRNNFTIAMRHKEYGRTVWTICSKTSEEMQE